MCHVYGEFEHTVLTKWSHPPLPQYNPHHLQISEGSRRCRELSRKEVGGLVSASCKASASPPVGFPVYRTNILPCQPKPTILCFSSSGLEDEKLFFHLHLSPVDPDDPCYDSGVVSSHPAKVYPPSGLPGRALAVQCLCLSLAENQNCVPSLVKVAVTSLTVCFSKCP